MAREFLMPKKIVSGEGALEEAAASIAACGAKALIVTDAVMEKLGNLKLVTSQLEACGIAYVVYDAVNSEPTDRMVYEGIRIFENEQCDFLVALGGGSSIDTMKAISMMRGHDGPISDFMGKPYSGEVCPMVAIPTTAGTGSEITQFTIIADTSAHVKMLLRGEALIPSLAVIDPVFTLSAPKRVTASTGVDALCHAIESYTSRKAQPLSEMFSLAATKLIFENLPKCFDEPGNVEARSAMSLAAMQAGIAFNNSSVSIIHGMSRPIGALFHVPHGLSNAMLIEACLGFAAEGAPGRFADIARYCGISAVEDDSVVAKALIGQIHDLLKHLQIPTLEQFGVSRDNYYASLDKMADDALASGSPQNTLRVPAKSEIIGLYKSIYR